MAGGRYLDEQTKITFLSIINNWLVVKSEVGFGTPFCRMNHFMYTYSEELLLSRYRMSSAQGRERAVVGTWRDISWRAWKCVVFVGIGGKEGGDNRRRIFICCAHRLPA